MGVPVLVRHDAGCRYARLPNGGHSDAAKRIADTWNLHWTASGDLAVGQWFAAALADGKSDNVLYASRRAAIAYQHHNERYYAYYRIMPQSMTVCAAESVLYWHRMAYDRGNTLPDPDARNGGPQIIPRLRVEDHNRQLTAIKTGTGFLGFGYSK